MVAAVRMDAATAFKEEMGVPFSADIIAQLATAAIYVNALGTQEDVQPYGTGLAIQMITFLQKVPGSRRATKHSTSTSEDYQM